MELDKTCLESYPLRLQNVKQLFRRLEPAVDTTGLKDRLLPIADQVFQRIFLMLRSELINLFLDSILDDIAPHIRRLALTNSVCSVNG